MQREIFSHCPQASLPPVNKRAIYFHGFCVLLENDLNKTWKITSYFFVTWNQQNQLNCEADLHYFAKQIKDQSWNWSSLYSWLSSAYYRTVWELILWSREPPSVRSCLYQGEKVSQRYRTLTDIQLRMKISDIIGYSSKLISNWHIDISATYENNRKSAAFAKKCCCVILWQRHNKSSHSHHQSVSVLPPIRHCPGQELLQTPHWVEWRRSILLPSGDHRMG